MNIDSSTWLSDLASLVTIIGSFYVSCKWLLGKLKADYIALSAKMQDDYVALSAKMQADTTSLSAKMQADTAALSAKMQADTAALSAKIDGVHVELKEDMREIREDVKRAHDRIDSCLVRIDRMYEILIQEIVTRRAGG